MKNRSRQSGSLQREIALQSLLVAHQLVELEKVLAAACWRIETLSALIERQRTGESTDGEDSGLTTDTQRLIEHLFVSWNNGKD
jgi:hypothetical protein